MLMHGHGQEQSGTKRLQEKKSAQKMKYARNLVPRLNVFFSERFLLAGYSMMASYINI